MMRTTLLLACLTRSALAFLPTSSRLSHRVQPLYSTQQEGFTFSFSPTSLQHLENTELPDDYSRPWTATKIKALAGAFGLGAILAGAGQFVVTSTVGLEQTWPLFFGIGAAAGYYSLGGAQVVEDERPMNGGYDRKLLADRPARLSHVLETLQQAKAPIITSKTTTPRDESQVNKYINQIHDPAYVDMLRTKSEQADRPQRLNPLYARTLIDQHSYPAARQACCDWMDSVDAALAGNAPQFALVRPPSHHACRAKGKGGCLLNSVAVAAKYALDMPGINSVAILDVDAHYGNGIAHCVQDDKRIRYCSLHEEDSTFYLNPPKPSDDDPRSPHSDDTGPLGNILNINLPRNCNWETYRELLQKQALPFLEEADVLLVAAGFDALEADFSSSLALKPQDYREMGAILKEHFGSRVAFGLEGGYAYTTGDLGNAIVEFVKPWLQV